MDHNASADERPWPPVPRAVITLAVTVVAALGIRSMRELAAPILMGLVVAVGAGPLIGRLMTDTLPQLQDQLSTLREDSVNLLARWGIDASRLMQDQVLRWWDPSIVTSGLTKRFGDEVAVDSVSFEVPRGSIFGYVGPSGSGKTTTIRMLLGIYEPSDGSVPWNCSACRHCPRSRPCWASIWPISSWGARRGRAGCGSDLRTRRADHGRAPSVCPRGRRSSLRFSGGGLRDLAHLPE